jgi:hypothetical protein
MKIQIHEPYIDAVDSKTIHPATISIPVIEFMSINQLSRHIDKLKNVLLEAEYIDRKITQEIKEKWGLE